MPALSRSSPRATWSTLERSIDLVLELRMGGEPLSRAFSAAFDGTCAECGNDIFEGDDIAMTDDGAVHAECDTLEDEIQEKFGMFLSGFARHDPTDDD